MNHLHRDQLEDGEQLSKFRSIFVHMRPLTPNDKNYKASSYNLLTEWETGEQTVEPLSWVITDDAVLMAQYATRHNLLDTPDWKRLRRLAKQDHKITRMAKQAKLRSLQMAPKYQYGFEVPRDYQHAVKRMATLCGKMQSTLS